jgi:N-ethylmaleimide reductase
MSHILFSSFHSSLIGKLNSRVSMSAMTRGFSINNHLCNELIAEYYERRAKDGVGLILTEGIIIHPTGDGYNNVPHLYTVEQANSWKITTEKVHQYGGKIFAQLWHCGRISHPDFTEGKTIVSSSNIQAEGINRQNNKPFGIPRKLEIVELPQIIDMYINSAEKAFAAGFDGVQIHMGHGYLIDQFFDSRINNRDDIYGGSIENRCRFPLEIIETLINKFGSSKIMIRISPSRFMGSIYEWPQMEEMLEYFIPKVSEIGLKLLDISCADANYYQTSGKVIRLIRKSWNHFLIGGASLSIEQATKEIEDGLLDMVTWGRFILANPDFIHKGKSGLELVNMTPELRAKLY